MANCIRGGKGSGGEEKREERRWRDGGGREEIIIFMRINLIIVKRDTSMLAVIFYMQRASLKVKLTAVTKTRAKTQYKRSNAKGLSIRY